MPLWTCPDCGEVWVRRPSSCLCGSLQEGAERIEKLEERMAKMEKSLANLERKNDLL